MIGEGTQGEGQEPVQGGVGDGAGVPKGAVARAAGDPDLGEPVHEGLAAVGVEHAHHDADESVVIGPERTLLLLVVLTFPLGYLPCCKMFRNLYPFLSRVCFRTDLQYYIHATFP